MGPDALDLSQVDQSNIFAMINSINFPVVLGGFVFYFFGGYFPQYFSQHWVRLLIKKPTANSLLLTAPMIIAITTAMNIVQDPNGPIAFWMSMIPPTSPISMMIRLPFGVPICNGFECDSIGSNIGW